MTMSLKRTVTGEPCVTSSPLRTRLLMCNDEDAKRLESIREAWKAEFHVLETLIHIQDRRYDQLQACGGILDFINLEKSSWPVKRKLGILVENEKGEPQALATCQAEYFASVKGWRLRLIHLVASPKNIVQEIKGSGKAALAQLKVLSRAFAVEELFLTALSDAKSFYVKLGFTHGPSIDRYFLSTTSMKDDNEAQTVDEQNVFIQIGGELKDEKLRRIAQSCLGCYYLFAIETAIGRGVLESLLAKPKVLKGMISKIEEKCKAQKENILQAYFECALYKKGSV